MTKNPKDLVREGYDRIAPEYAEWSGRIVDEERRRSDEFLLETLPAGVPLLDLGCGNGLPSTARLAEHFQVTGVDASAGQLARARRNVPGATFIQADMAEVVFPAATFQAVVAYYSIIHLPREEHAALFCSIAIWLQPGGWFVCSLGAGASDGGIEPDWLGAPMYWSHHDADTSRRLIEAAGLEVVQQMIQTIDEDGTPATFAWFRARKPE